MARYKMVTRSLSCAGRMVTSRFSFLVKVLLASSLISRRSAATMVPPHAVDAVDKPDARRRRHAFHEDVLAKLRALLAERISRHDAS